MIDYQNGLVYVLTLQDGCYWVGKTENVYGIIEHYKKKKPGTPEWILKHPVEEFYCLPGYFKYENTEYTTTLKFMRMFGIDNVRGSIYSSVVLPDETRKTIGKILFTNCHGCGKSSHSINDCSIGLKCKNCGKEGHYTLECGYHDANAAMNMLSIILLGMFVLCVVTKIKY